MLFWRSPFTGGGEDIRLKAADCPGDWAHWGGALGGQQSRCLAALGVCGGGCRVHQGKPCLGSLWFHMLVNHTCNYKHGKFSAIQGLIEPLGWICCFFWASHGFLSVTYSFMATHEMLVSFLLSERSQSTSEKQFTFQGQIIGNIACICVHMWQWPDYVWNTSSEKWSKLCT
jgi:hypothetical protein